MASGSLTKRRAKRSSASVPPAPQMGSSSPAHRNLSAPRNISSRPRTCCSLRAALLAVFVVFLLSVAWSAVSKESGSSPQFYSFEIVNEYHHDPSAFTQGLLYAGNDTLFESTGLYSESTVRKVLLQTGKVQALHKMGNSFFGEGLTLLGERLFQVTWLKTTGFIYDKYNLKKLGTFTHQMTDGWGLATDGKVIIGSDGTSSLYEIDPHTFKVISRATVRYKDREVTYLNELEYINGEVWANVWQSDCIARISHKDGKVLGWILLHQLREQLITSGNNHIDVLNGIAWDEDKKRIFVTGKLWPKLYEIKLHPVVGPLHGNIENLCLLR